MTKKDNVVVLDVVTTLDIPVERVMENAKDKLDGAIILGYDKEGEEYFASTFADGGTVLWLLERMKKRLLETDEE
jgi:hypothetical protein